MLSKLNANEEALIQEDKASEESLKLSKGDWVVVMLDSNKYPGEITNIRVILSK